MEHILTQDSIDKLAEIFVYLDLLSDFIAMLVLYEQLAINRERRSLDADEKQELRARLDRTEARLNELEAVNRELLRRLAAI